VDQTVPANQGILRHLGKRGQDANLDSYLDVCVDRFGEKTVEHINIPLHLSTDSERERIRASRYFKNTYKSCWHDLRGLYL